MNAPLTDRLDRERQTLARLQQHYDAVYGREKHWTETDTATGSGIRRKPNAKAEAHRLARYDREAKVVTELQRQRELVADLERRLASQKAETERVHYTRADLDGAKYVRTRYRWHKIVRVNQKTVSVETGYSWVDRYPFEDLWEVRK